MDNMKMAAELFDAFIKRVKMRMIMPCDFRVKPGQMGILGYLASIDSPRAVTELSRRFGVAPSSVSQMISDLERKGLVERIHGKQDRRIVYVNLTLEGRTMLRGMKSAALERLSDLARYLGEEDCRELCRIMDRCERYFSKETEAND